MVKKAIESEFDNIPQEGGLIKCISKNDNRKRVSNAPSKAKQIENMGFKDMSQTVDIFIEEISIRFEPKKLKTLISIYNLLTAEKISLFLKDFEIYKELISTNCN